jgi:Ion transport protein
MQSNFEDARNMSDPDLGVALLCLFLLIGPILLLNLLIALMNSTYSTIQENADAEWRRERAEILLEQFSIFHRCVQSHIRSNTDFRVPKFASRFHMRCFV